MPKSNQRIIYMLARIIVDDLRACDVPINDWYQITQSAVKNGLGPLLLWKLTEQETDKIPLAAYKNLENSAKISEFNAQLYQETQSKVNDAFLQSKIPSIWLKGFALAFSSYPLPYLRPMDDLDVLVPCSLATRAYEVVTGIGFYSRPQDPLTRKIDSSVHTDHHYSLRGGPSNSIILELHFRLLGDDRLLPIQQMDWFWHQKKEIRSGTGIFSIFNPEAQFLYICAHTILQHGEAEFRLQRYYDLHLLASSAMLDWDKILKKAIELGWAKPVERAIFITHDHFSTNVPEWVLSYLRNEKSPKEVLSRTKRLKGGGHRWEGTLISIKKHAPIKRLLYLYYLAFPPASYMRMRYDIPPGHVLFTYYCYRWLDAAKEILRSVMQRLNRNKSDKDNRE